MISLPEQPPFMLASLSKHCTRCPLPILLAGLLVAITGCQILPVYSPQAKQIRVVLAGYKESLNQRSVDQLFPLLADKIQIDGLTDELSRAGLKAGMHWPPARITDMQVLSFSQKPAGPEVKVALYLSHDLMLMRIGFDENLRIRTIDPVPLWKTPEAKPSRAFSSDFTENNGLMFVRAKANGRAGFFLLDTGSSGLLLNKKYFSPDSREELPGVVSTVQGIKAPLGRLSIRSLEWGALHAGNIRGQLHDFSVMETPPITPLLGAIGFEQLRNCAVTFDWKHKSISARPAKKAAPLSGSSAARRPRAVIPFAYFLHTPAFCMHVGDKVVPMIFDSGAQINLVPGLEGIEDHFHRIAGPTRLSDGGEVGKDTALLGLLDAIRVGGLSFPDMPFAVFAVPYLSKQGILGTPLLRSGPVEINFVSRTITIW